VLIKYAKGKNCDVAWREKLYKRALKLIAKGASPPNGVGLHFDEINFVAEQVLVGKTDALELYEKENWDEVLDCDL
jgi:hypothetical protein